MIGAGPAGLTYASLVADGNSVTVFEKNSRSGGSFRYAGKAPLFQEVEANERSFERYVGDMTAACVMKGVMFRYNTDVTALPGLLAPFDRIVIASGARYRFGVGKLVEWLLDRDVARAPGVARLFKRRRCATGSIIAPAKPPRRVSGIWRNRASMSWSSATPRAPARASKPSRSAFEAALLPAGRLRRSCTQRSQPGNIAAATIEAADLPRD